MRIQVNIKEGDLKQTGGIQTMPKRKNIILASSLALVLMSSFLTGCTKDTEETKQTKQTESESVAKSTINEDGTVNYSAVNKIDNFKKIPIGIEEPIKTLKAKQFVQFLVNSYGYMPTDRYIYKDASNLLGTFDSLVDRNVTVKAGVIYNKDDLLMFDFQIANTGGNLDEKGMQDILLDVATKSIYALNPTKDLTNLTSKSFKVTKDQYHVYKSEDFAVRYKIAPYTDATDMIGTVEIMSPKQYTEVLGGASQGKSK